MHHDLIAAVNRKAIFGAVVLEQAAADINPFLKFVFRLTGLTAFSNPHFIIFQGREAAVSSPLVMYQFVVEFLEPVVSYSAPGVAGCDCTA